MENTDQLSTSIIYRDGHSTDNELSVISEHELSVIVNERPVYRLICTKDHLKELIIGRLLSDGLIEDADDISRLLFCKYENEASVFLKHEIQWKEKISKEATCCTGNKTFLSSGDNTKLKQLPECEIRPEWIFSLTEEFGKDAGLHKNTGGTHICILGRQGKVEFKCEDIGRHNAIDKAIGYALLYQIPLKDCMLFTSGRVPVDMVEKVIAAGSPVLISKSVPTLQSAELAGKYGLHLICKAWPDKYVLIS